MLSRLFALTAAALVAQTMLTAPAQASLGPDPAGSLLNSTTPKTAIIDITTGAVLSVRTGITARPLIANQNFCYPSNACYYSGQVPWADQGFEGSPGTITGSWPSRSGGYTGEWVAKYCWNAGVCGPKLNLHTAWSFGGGGLATGISVQIF